jgi:protoheme IX farnesyltransferase
MSANEPEEPKEKPSFGQLVKDYIALTKPRVISLLLFTTVLAMYLPEGQWPHWTMVLWVTIGGYMAAGAANTFNMVIERDLDLAMERTASRPTVDRRISVKHALIFGVILAVGSFAVLTLAANVLAALLAWAGLAFYVLIYTLVLKRRTWQNIVIGGAAGSFPPLVGYAAVAGELNLYAWMLFALVFMWTPVHFWALAILIKEDYAKAGVPMLPVVKGERATVVQITIYAFLTALVSVIPLFQQAVGMVYIIGAGVLNLILVAQSIQLMRHTDKPRARALFKYSMAYLALMFIVLAIDRGMMQ